MKYDELAALISRLEILAARHPRVYQLRVIGVAALGYACLGSIMFLIVALLAIIVWALNKSPAAWMLAMVGAPLLALLLVLSRSLWVTIPKPNGFYLRREHAPALFAEIEALRRAMRAPRPHFVVVTSDFNAAVSQIPRFGIFGFSRIYLCIGLPLLSAFSLEQFRAVLAHELAHLSRAHTRTSHWIYWIRATWAQIGRALPRNPSELETATLHRLIKWYEPYVRAYSVLLARRHGAEADLIAASVVGARAAATSLAAIQVREQYRAKVIWPRLTERMKEVPVPPPDVYASVNRSLSERIPLDFAASSLAWAMRAEAHRDAVHPALAPRLEAMGSALHTEDAIRLLAKELAWPVARADTAAARLLGPVADTLPEEFDLLWRDQHAAMWKERFTALTAAKDPLHVLRARAQQGALTPDEQFSAANMTEDLEGAEAALPLVTALVNECPQHVSALYMLGRLLLAERNDAGLAHLELAMELDPAVAAPVSMLIASYLPRVGRSADAIPYRVRAESLMADEAAEEAAVHLERDTFERKDAYASPVLDESTRRALHDHLATFPQVGRAWMARKVTTRVYDSPIYIFVIERAGFWSYYATAKSTEVLGQRVRDTMSLPAGTLYCVVNGDCPWLIHKLNKVPDAEVYRRRSWLARFRRSRQDTVTS